MKNITIEEKKILLESLKDSNNGNKELTMIDYELIEGSLLLMKFHSLMPQKKRGSRVMLNQQIENLLDLAMAKEKALNIAINPTVLDIKSVASIVYDFRITYKKSKGKSIKRIHTDNYTATAQDEESAIANLKHRLKTLKETLVSIENISKKQYMYLMKDGSTILKSNVVDYFT